MITSGQLSYIPPQIPWLFWEFDSTVANALVIAALSTIISYQLTAAVFDLLLGLKERKLARVNIFQVLLLVRRSSPISVVNSLLRRDWLTGIYFKGYLPERSHISRDTRPIRHSVTIRLIILLAAAPLINIIAVVLTFEKHFDVTFAGAGFGGVALGINSNNSRSAATKTEKLTERCDVFPILAERGDNVVAQFSTCLSIRQTLPSSDSFTAQVYVEMRNSIDVVVGVELGGVGRSLRKTAMLDTDSGVFHVRSTTTVDQAKGMVDPVVEQMLNVCDDIGIGEDDFQAHQDDVAATSGNGTAFLTAFNCKNGPNDTRSKELTAEYLEQMGEKITFMETEDLLVIDVTTLQEVRLTGFDNGAMEVLLKRRRRIVSLILMAVLAGLSVLLRVFLAIILNNDLHDGIERLIKERLGVKYCQSLLRHGDFRVDY